MPRKYTTEERVIAFWNKITITSNPDLCWEWIGCLNPDGYGSFRLNGKSEKSHRIAWSFPDYVIPDGMSICHSCDNPSCCNPKHLFLGTHLENMQDMKAKGRRNDNNHYKKLTDIEVEEIRNRYAMGNVRQIDLAIEYNVIQAHISRIVRKVMRI